MARVLVVDDSALMRQFMGELLEAEGDMQVYTARDGLDALAQLRTVEPDVITLDINMPGMDGLTALAHIMTERPTPVVVVSSLSTRSALATLEALAMGAVDYIAKPAGTVSLDLDGIAAQLRAKVRAASQAKVAVIPACLPVTEAMPVLQARHGQPAGRAAREDVREESAAIGRSLRTERGRRIARRLAQSPPTLTRAHRPSTWPTTGPGARKTPAQVSAQASASAAEERATYATAGVDLSPGYGDPAGLVLIGVSTGGPRLLPELLRAISPMLPWPVVIAQHMPPSFTESFARRLDEICPLPVREVTAEMPVKPGHVYLARGGTDLAVVRRQGRLWLQPVAERPDHLWHPSVEHLVTTAMDCLPARQLVGVMLTGMGYDGADAMATLKKSGGRTVAESKDTAVVYGMPKELIARDGATEVLAAPLIPALLHRWLDCLSAPPEGPLPSCRS